MPQRKREEGLEIVADGLFTVAEAAGYLALSRSSVYALMDAGELAFVKIGKSRRIPKRSVYDLAARHLRGGWKID